VRRSAKKEQHAIKFFKQTGIMNQFKKDKMDERRNRAMSTVKSAVSRNEKLGMRHYRENFEGIEGLRDQKTDFERAKSAAVYHTLVSRKEITEAGGDYMTLLKLKKKIKFGDGISQPLAPYRNSMTV
jgi:hypothetical protein